MYSIFFNISGLFYGFCGKRPGNVYGDDCCNRGTGANWLLAGVYLTFLFSLVLLALTTALFLAQIILFCTYFFEKFTHLGYKWN